jgi:hypothetical protein
MICVARVGSVLLLPKDGFAICEGIHKGAVEVDVNDPVREGGSLGPNVVAVEGRDEVTLTMDDRLDEIVDASDGRIIGDSPGDGSSTVTTCTVLDGRVVLLLNSGFGINSVSMWKVWSGKHGDVLS